MGLWPGNDPGKNGSWRVVGNAGTIAGHAIPVGYDTVFVMGRPTPKVGAGDHTPLPAYLAVRLLPLNAVLHRHNDFLLTYMYISEVGDLQSNIWPDP